MLQTIRDYIETLDSKPSFGKYYQQYVKSVQDSIVNHDVALASREFTTIEDTAEVIKGLNALTEELKRL